MEKNISIAIVIASIIIGGSLMYSTTKISNSMENAGGNITSSNFQIANSLNEDGTIENFELIVIDGWLYLYNSASGQIWKKPDNDDPDETWQAVKHIGE